MPKRSTSISSVCLSALAALSLGCSSGGSSGGGGFTSVFSGLSAAFFPVTVAAGAGSVKGNLAFAADGDLLAVGGNNDTLFDVSRDDGSLRELATNVSGGNDLLSVVEVDGVVYVGDDAGNIFEVDDIGASSLVVALGAGPVHGLVEAPAGYGAFGGRLVAATDSGGVIAVDPANPGSPVVIANPGASYADLEFDSSGTLYVADQTAGEVVTVSSGGTVATFASGFATPVGLGVDAGGDQLFVADAATDTLSSVRLSDAAVTAVAAYAFEAAPSGLAFDGVSTLVIGTAGSFVLRAVSVPEIDAALFPIVVVDADVGAGNLTLDGKGNFVGTANQTQGVPGNQLFRLSRDGDLKSLASDLGATGAGLYAVAVEPASGDIYVGSDFGEIFRVGSGDASLLVPLDSAVNGLAFAPETFGALGGRLIAVTDDGDVIDIDIDDPGVPTPFASLEDGVNGEHRLLGLAFAADGTLYVADDTVDQIRTVTPGGGDAFFADLVAGFPAADDPAATPDGLAIDEGSGRLFVADSLHDALLAVSLEDGTVSSLAGFDFDGGFRPSGLAFDGLGGLVVDTGETALRLRRFDAFPPGFAVDAFPIGLVSDVGAGGLGIDVESRLLGIANDIGAQANLVYIVNRDGSVETLHVDVGDPTIEALLGLTHEPITRSSFVGTDLGNIYALSETGIESLLVDVAGEVVQGLAIAPSTYGELRDQLVVVTGSGKVLSIDPSDPIPVTITDLGSTLTDLVFSSAGTLYVVDGDAGAIVTVTPAGAVATLASGLGFPDGVAIDEVGGRLFVADSGIDMLRQVTIPGGVVSNLAAFDFDDGAAPSGIAYDGRGNVLVQTGETGASLEIFPIAPAP